MFISMQIGYKKEKSPPHIKLSKALKYEPQAFRKS